VKRKITSDPVQVPNTPRYLWTDRGAVLPIESVTDAGLRQLARLWERALIRKARYYRKKQQQPPTRREGER